MTGTIFAAWATSVIGFGVIGFSSIAALRDFALVGSLGLLGAFLATFTVLPPLLMMTDRNDTAARLRFNVLPLLLALTRRRRMAMGLIAAVLIAAIIIVAWPGVRLQLDSDLTSMHPRPNPALDAEMKVARIMNVSPESILVFLSANSDATLVHRSHEVTSRLQSSDAKAAGITGTFGLANLLPDSVAAANRANAIKPDEADKIVSDFRAAVAASDFDPRSYEPYASFLHRLLTQPRPPNISDLAKYPQLAKTTISRAMISQSAAQHPESITLLFTDRPLDQRDSRIAIVSAARSALSTVPSATLTGLSVVGLDAESIIRDQAPRMLFISGILIAAFLLIFFRSMRDTLLAFLPTLFALLLLMATARVSGQTLNMMNLLVVPLIMGIDTDYGIFLVGLTRHAQHHRGERACRELSASFYALGISAASAALGFGSLAFTSVPAIRSLGWAMGVGVSICFIATLLFRVPMLLREDTGATE
ncbi:MAG: MMPL family transporter [Phycisphaerae bacterium]|nr:MMPL family transporter [Phycisphaerae bacterium]